MSTPETLRIDGTEYVRADSVSNAPTGNRCIVVLPSGWIFVGNLSHNEADENGATLRLTNASNIRKWASGGFGGLTKSRTESGADLDPCGDVVFSYDKPLLMVPVDADW